MIPVTSNATVVDRFLSAAERYPDAIAARDRRDSTTYRALRAWTAAIAGRPARDHPAV